MAASGGGDQEARFSVNLDGNAAEVSEETAAALVDLKKQIDNGIDSIKNMSGSLRRLKGNSDEVKAAKEELKNKISATRDALSTATLATVKLGSSYEKVTAQTKAAASEQAKLAAKLKEGKEKDAADRAKTLSNALKVAGGPIEEATSKLDALKGILGGTGGAMGVTVLAGAGLVAAIAATTAASIAGLMAFGKWVLETGNAARNMGLMREAALGSAQQSANLGTQVDALADKLVTPKEKLNELATELSKMSRLTGPEIVDTFNAVGQASEAMGDTVGNKFKDILTRGQRFQRLQINPFELQGTGVEFTDVAAQLAKNTGRSVKDAQQALFQGRVKLDVGAKAIRDVVEARFGEINGKKLSSLEGISNSLHNSFVKLTSGVNIEPVFKSLQKIFDLLDPSKSVAGVALKQIITDLGGGMVDATTKGTPSAVHFFKLLVLGALELEGTFLRARNAIRGALDGINLSKLVNMNDVMSGGKLVVEGLGIALAAAAVSAGALALSLAKVLESLGKIKESVGGAIGAGARGDGKGVGLNIGNGLTEGLKLSQGGVQFGVNALLGAAVQAAEDKLKIHSPSKVFSDIGQNVADGFALGIDGGSSGVDKSMSAMVAPRGGGSQGGGSSAGATITIQIDARGATKEAVAALTGNRFLDQFTDEVELACKKAGILIQPMNTTPSILPVGS